MRVRYLIFLFAILIVAFTKQSNQLLIKGKVANYSKNYVLFAFDSIGYGLSFNVDTIKVDNNGSFVINKDHKLYNSFLLFEEAKPIRLSIPKFINKPISIDLDCSKSDSILFEGEQAAFLKFDLDQKKYWIKIFQEMSIKHPEIGLGSGNNKHPLYFVIQDSITQLRIQFLEKYFEDINITGKKDFISRERNTLLYSNLYYRISVPNNEIIKQLAFYKNLNNNSTNTLTYSKEVSFLDDNLFEINDYQQFMNDFIMKAARVENPQGNFSSYDFYLDKGLDIIDKWFLMPHTNNLQKIVFVNHLITTATVFKAKVDIDRFYAVIEKLRNLDNNSRYTSAVDANLKKLKNSMTKQYKEAYTQDFKLKDTHGKVYHLSDFKNKRVFIDVWASWCAPCIVNIPKWNDFVRKYSGNNDFQFISISIDDNVGNWNKAVEKYKPNGLKLIAAGGFKSDFARLLEINAIPAYISIDREGNIFPFSGSLEDFLDIIKKN